MIPSRDVAESQPPVVSICIPTFNRASMLRRCLNLLLPQIPGKPVEVVVVDNASTDQTPEVIQEFLPKYPGLRYFRNPANLGYCGQAKCIEHSSGKYTAILCDDDVYAPNAVDTMLPVLSKGDFSFVALNYYGFVSDPSRVLRNSEAPEESFQREDAYDVWDYPSVGHYSGLVLNTALAKSVLPLVWKAFTREEYENFRGVLGSVVVHAIKQSSLPGYFIGQRIVGAGQPETVDYDSLGHICIDTYQFLHTLEVRGVLTRQNIQRREEEILGLLPKALVRHGGFLTLAEFDATQKLLHSWFDGDPRFKRSARLLEWMRFRFFRALLRLIAFAYLSIRPFRRQLQRWRSSR